MIRSQYEIRESRHDVQTGQEPRRGDRQVQVRRLANLRTVEIWLDDPDDRKRDTADGDGPPDHVPRPVVLTLPEAMADHGHRPVGAAAPPIVALAQRAPHDRQHTEALEEATAHPGALDGLSLTRGREVEACRGEGEAPLQ